MVDLNWSYSGFFLMTEEQKISAVNQLVKALEALRDGPKPDTGICAYVEETLEGSDAGNLWNLSGAYVFSEWSEFSGDLSYPVGYHGKTGYSAFWSLDRWSGEYGAARMRLLNHLIRYYSSVDLDELESVGE